MSTHSLEVAKAAQKDKSLLGTTNQADSKFVEQPHTASKVEKSNVQAGNQDPSTIVGNTNNAKSHAIKEEFREDKDTTSTRANKKAGEDRDTSTTDFTVYPEARASVDAGVKASTDNANYSTPKDQDNGSNQKDNTVRPTAKTGTGGANTGNKQNSTKSDKDQAPNLDARKDSSGKVVKR